MQEYIQMYRGLAFPPKFALAHHNTLRTIQQFVSDVANCVVQVLKSGKVDSKDISLALEFK